LQPSPPEPGNISSPGPRPDFLAGQQLPPPPQQERSRRKRHALLQSALALFAQRGYEDTSIEDIARQAHVSVGGFYQHFASKRQILLVLMDSLIREADSLTFDLKGTDPQSIRDAITQIVTQSFKVDWGYVGLYRAWHEAAIRDHELQAISQQIDAWTIQQMTFFFQATSYLPNARQDIDRNMLAWEIALLFLRLAEIPPEDPAPLVASLTDLIYHALFTDTNS
jgi:TetR/AcrR family transcriptional repressor of mexJK operon